MNHRLSRSPRQVGRILAVALSCLSFQLITACGGSNAGEPPYASVVSSSAVVAPSVPQAIVTRFTHTMPAWQGGTTQATALLLTPRGAPPAGGWPVVAWAHGTTSAGYKGCAPSETLGDLDGGLTADGFVSNYAAVLGYLVAAGYAVVAPDFEGLGSAATVPYPHFSADSEARSLVAAVKAARSADATLSRKWLAMGHSEGGRGVLVLHNYVGEAAELDFRGSVALAPIASIAAIGPILDSLRAADPGHAVGYTVVQNLQAASLAVGLKTVNPGVDLSALMGADLAAALPLYATQCIFKVAGALGAQIATHPAFAGIKPAWTSVPAVQSFLERNDPGAMPGFKLTAPTLIAQGTADTFVLEQVTRDLAGTLAARGSPVSYRTYAGADHGTIVMDAKADVLAFIAARFAQ